MSITKWLLLFSLAVALPARGLVFFLEHSVLLSLTESEFADLKEFAKQTLTEANDAETRKWRSRETKAQALLKPALTYQYDGNICRRMVAAVRNAEDDKNLLRLDYCKYDDKWRYQPVPTIEMTKQETEAFLSKVEFVLEHSPLKSPATWQTNTSGIFATFVVVSEDTDTPCRELATTLRATRGGEMSGVYQFCKEDSQWTYVKPAV